MWLRIYKVFYFGSFTEFDMMSEKCPQLSRKWRISGKLFWAPNNFKSMSMKFPEFVWHCSRDSEIITIFILDLWLSLTWCRRNDPNCQENERFMENCFSLWTMLKVFRWSLLSFFGRNSQVLTLKFHWVCRDVGRMPRIISKKTYFWKIVLGSRKC